MSRTAIPVRAKGREVFADPERVLACRKGSAPGRHIEVRIADLAERREWFVVLNSKGLTLREFMADNLGWSWPGNIDMSPREEE